MALVMDRDEQHSRGGDREFGHQRDAPAHAPFAELAVEPTTRTLESGECRPREPMPGQDGHTLQSGEVALARMPGSFAGIAQTQLDELDAERVACAQMPGEIGDGMAIARAGHSDIDLAQQHDVTAGTSSIAAEGAGYFSR